MPIGRSQKPGEWFRVPGLTAFGSHWTVSFSIGSAFTERIHWLIIGLHCFDIVMDAHERYASGELPTIYFSLQVDPRYGDSVYEALRKEKVSDLQRIYMYAGNHELPPPQLPVPEVEERQPSLSEMCLHLVR